MPTATQKRDKKHEFIVHVTRFGVLTNYEEVHKARLEGRTADAVLHYFEKATGSP